MQCPVIGSVATLSKCWTGHEGRRTLPPMRADSKDSTRTETDKSLDKKRGQAQSRPMVRSRWAAIGAAVAVSLGAGGIGLTSAISTNGGNSFVPIAPCRLFDTRPGAPVGPRTAPLGPGETYTQQVTGTNGQCVGISADATAVALNVTAVQGTAVSYLTIFPADLGSPPNASNLNWLAGEPPAFNKVDTKLSPTGAIKLFNASGTIHVLADIVGYYEDHNHDDRYPRRMSIPYDLAPGEFTADIEIPPNVPVSLTGVGLSSGFRGVASATLLSIAGDGGFIEWTGLESTAGSVITQGFSGAPGTHILYLDWGHVVDVEVASATAIRIHNEAGAQRSGTITLIW